MGGAARVASASAASREWFGSRPWREWAVVTGDWSTLRSWLAQRGVDVAVGETADASTFTTTAGGRHLKLRGLLDGALTADARALHVPGATALLQLQWLPGQNATATLGDVQGFSNIDADDVPLVGELWYQQEFGKRVRIKAGRVDANSDFAYLNANSDFLSASMGFSPSIVAFPSYPTPSSSIGLFVMPASHLELGGGLFNGTPEDGRWVGWQSRFAIAQARTEWTSLGGAATIGWWRHDQRDAPATSGAYLATEQVLWTDGERNAAAFVQIGTSNRASDVRRHIGGGVATRGVFARRRMDVTGVGATWVQLAPADRDAPNELALEWFHRIVVTPSISVIPDVQIIRRPGGYDTGRVVAFTCRIRLDL
jgi:carbohydrate-selective porin OprB